MKLEVLISTMNRDNFDLIEQMNINSDALIINQTTYNNEKMENKNQSKHRVLSFNEKGLSKSRNRAIEYSNGEICLIADDDVRYHNDYIEKILRAHEEYPSYDLIVFAVPTTNTDRMKNYYSKKKKMGYLRSMKVASYEISFKKNSIVKNKIYFKKEFGAGSGKYSMGEENIFLYECLKKGLKILYLPVEIGTVTHEDSTWFTGFNKKFFIDRGASYAAMSHKYSYFLSIQFALRKRKLYRNEMSVNAALSYMINGIKEYENNVRKNQIK